VTYVITEACIGEKNGACVDVCPAACIHTTPDAPQNYIDPDICIECEQCVLVCPVHAVFLDVDVPDEWQGYIGINADFFRQNKPRQEIGLDRALRMTEAIRGFALHSGFAVAAVVLDARGERLASVCLDGTDSAVLEQADRKAYTALSYGVATHELRPTSKPLWLSPDSIDAQRVLMVGGGYPIVTGADTIGAVGVAGTPTPAEDIRCCQAALGR
jgi:ferredoxin